MKTRLAVVAVAAALATSSVFAAPTRQTTPLPKLAARSFPLPVPQHLAAIITEAANRYGVDPNLVAAMAFRESRFDPNAVSRRGARGVMQLMPRTAASLGVTDSFDPRQNILGGTKYLRSLLDRFNGNVDLALAGYNAGPDLVARVGPRATEEAIHYVAAVKQYYLNARRTL